MLRRLLKQIPQIHRHGVLQRRRTPTRNQIQNQNPRKISHPHPQTNHQRHSSTSLSIQELHTHNIIHRDLKAENILSHNGVYKIADFGFSKQVENIEEIQQTTLGTITTMAPEVMRKEKYGLKVTRTLYRQTSGQLASSSSRWSSEKNPTPPPTPHSCTTKFSPKRYSTQSASSSTTTRPPKKSPLSSEKSSPSTNPKD